MHYRSRLGLVATLVVFLAWTAFVPAQLRPGDAQKFGSKTDVSDFRANGGNIEFDNYLKGTKPPSGEQAKNLFELATRVYVFRVTWFDSVQRSPEVMDQARHEFKRVIDLAVSPEAVKLWTPMLVGAFKKVLDLPIEKNRLSVLNGALLLPDLAKLKQPAIADLLVTVLEDPKKHDAVKLWAAQAMTQFFPAAEFDVIQSKGIKAAEQKRDTDLKRVNALLKFVSRPWNAGKETPQGEIDAFCYVRRVAVKALGDARVPAIVADPKGQKLEGAVAPVLLAIAKGTVSPEPTLAEKLEAAIALSRIQVSATSCYQPEESIYRVGKVMEELAGKYKSDYNQFAGAGAKVKSDPILPWKYYGKRLQLALVDLVDSVKNDTMRQDAADNARKLNSNSAVQQMLNGMQAQKHQANYDPLVIAGVVKTLEPKSAEVFKGINTAPASGE